MATSVLTAGVMLTKFAIGTWRNFTDFKQSKEINQCQAMSDWVRSSSLLADWECWGFSWFSWPSMLYVHCSGVGRSCSSTGPSLARAWVRVTGHSHGVTGTLLRLGA